MKARERESAKRIDTVGSIALLAGITTPLYALLEPTEPTPDLWDLCCCSPILQRFSYAWLAAPLKR